ncbi:MAG TPA: hypothetical protein GX507_01850 [Clostridia bacterium]|nr:hypothetical protein [Clostridia bacterium]
MNRLRPEDAKDTGDTENTGDTGDTAGPANLTVGRHLLPVLPGAVKWLLLLSGVLMTLGVARGELLEIRLNAVTLCLSCLGLGR